jgi:hypothetical protein
MVGLLADLLRIGIYKVSGEALEAVTVLKDGLKIAVGRKTTLLGTMHSELLTVVSLGKESRMTEQRLVAVEKMVGDPTEDNLKAVSQTFQLPVKDTERIMISIQNLFGEKRRFIRSAFEMNPDILANHGNRAFELSWCVAKVLEGRNNRVAFLNALQHLISRMQRTKQALRFLLADFCRFPNTVRLSDRNAIMLSNILLRLYNKELDVDIEMTPEEVLNVRNGLDKDAVNYAQFRLDTVETRFASKVCAIHEQLTALLEDPVEAQKDFSIRHLLLLEREIFIFLSLLSGKTAHMIMISALNEYGNPDAGIYSCSRAISYLPFLFQQLKVIIRGVGRIGTPDDIASLEQIKRQGDRMMELYGSRENQLALTRTLRGIDNAITSISMTHG